MKKILEYIRLPKTKRIIKTFLFSSAIVCLAILVLTAGINFYVKQTVKDRILTPEEAVCLDDVDCVLILGCGVWGENPSHLLADRLEKGIALQKLGVSDKLLMSGDHGRVDYNEVSVMKQYAISSEIDSADIFMDHAGFSTYESMYRAKEVFGAQKIVIVTQEYHMSRALYIANSLGLEAYGVPADYRYYAAQKYWDAREVLARVKDYFYTVVKPLPTYLGEPIDLSGDGNVTNDKNDNFYYE
ncbi:MAG: SanA protein [Ruminococcaceae bacterium]|nr:SanA protein [Oscillospiraceae bacterium]